MDAVNKPAPISSVTAGTNSVALSNLDARAQVARRYQPLVAVTLAVASGIVLDRYGPHNVFAHGVDSACGSPAFLSCCSACAGCLGVWWLAWRRRCDGIASWVLLAAAAFAGSAWHELNWFLFDRYEIARYAAYDPAPVCLEAIARQSPERVAAPQPTPLRAIPAGERSRLLIELTRVRDGQQWRPAGGICQLSVEGHLLGVHPGDRLRLFGHLARISPTQNPGEFDFADHARADRQLVRVRSSFPECVTTLAHGGTWNLSHLLDALRVRAKQLIRSLVGPDRAGLAAAILVGAREGLPYDETEAYMLTGSVHVLVVSGLHVAIVAMALWGLMRIGWLSRRTALILIMSVVVIYAAMAELHPSVVRAATLCVLMCFAMWTGRRGVVFNSIFAAALIVLAMNPSELFRAGPQLSFLAVASLVWIGSGSAHRTDEPPDRLEEMLAALRPWYRRAAAAAGRWIGWLMVTSAVIWLVTLPLVLNQFHVAAPVAIIIAPAIWLLLFAAMWSGLAMLSTALLIPPVAALCGSVCNRSLGGLEAVVRWAESVPAGHVWLSGPAWWWVVGFYMGLLVVMIWGTSVLPRRWQLGVLAAWILIGLVPFATRGWTRRGLECTVVAVGHGECVVLEAPSGETLLYDAGGIGSPEYATQSIASLLWSHGIMRIDGIVLSHADTDHYNAVPGLLARFRVGTIYVSPVMFPSTGDAENRGPKVLQTAIQRAGVPIREIWSGDRLRIGPDVAIQVLHPPRKGVIGSDNANSVTLGVEYAGQRVLLPGDLESPGLDDVMAEVPYHCDVLLAPHHGSRRSDPPGFAAWSTPKWVVLSGGGGELAEPVIRTYERAGARVLVTDEVGAVQCKVQPDSPLQMTAWHAARPSVPVSASQP